MKTKQEPKPTREKISKRIIGTVFLIAGGVMTGILFARALAYKIADPGTALTLIKYTLVAGGALWGIAIGDGVRKYFQDKK